MQDRDYLMRVLTTTAQPVLLALAEQRLHERLPLRDWERHRAHFSLYEAFARTLAGITPWLELGPDDTPEGELRARFIDLGRVCSTNTGGCSSVRSDNSPACAKATTPRVPSTCV